MAEGRMLKKRISKSHKFAALKSHNARLLYLMIYPHLDIKGRFDADPVLIKGEITPLLNFSRQKIQEYLEDMHRVKLIKLYKTNNQWYLETTRFTDFQSLRPDHEAKSECPDPITGQLRELVSPIKVKESKGKESKDKEKQCYLDFVLLTKDEHKKLIERLGQSRTTELIEELNNGIGSKGYRYKSHYFTILNWARRKAANGPKAKKCIHCPKVGVYVEKDDTGQQYWLCEDHKPKHKPLDIPLPQIKSVPDGKVDINAARNRQKDGLGVK